MGVLCPLIADNLDRSTAVGRLCLDWKGDPSPSADSIPLRFCGGLHALVLTGRAPALAAQYPPDRDGAPDWSTIEAALNEHEAFLLDWMTSPPQTNEVARSGIVWPAMMVIAEQTGLPLRLLEVGASAGLNLQMDRFAYRYGDEIAGEAGSGVTLEPELKGAVPNIHTVSVTSRAACDLNPLDPGNETDALRLRAYLWPDQKARMERLDAAIAIARNHPAPVDRMDAVAWLEHELDTLPAETCTVIYSTIAWQYLPESARDAGEAVVAKAAKQAGTDAPLAWLQFEADGESPGAGIRLRLWPDGSDRLLGRGDFHGRWLDWHRG